MNDAQHFILEHFDTIHNSPSHIYSYALPFSPPSSWLQKYYQAELPQGVRVVKGVLAEWGTCSRTAFLNELPDSLAYWNGTIAVGLYSGSINILDAITGSQVAVLSGHTDCMSCLTFSLDGAFLVSGSHDKNVKLWDVQTGGVVKTFCGHIDWVHSVSISPDCTTIASGSHDRTICLWHVQAGDCFCIIDGFDDWVNSVSFSPANPQLLISATNNNVQQWDINGCQIGPTHKGQGVAFSSDGSYFVSWRGRIATVYNSGSRAVVAELQGSSGPFGCCCFSPNGKLVAGGVGSTIHVWSITGSNPCLMETLIGHTAYVYSLVFPASLISASHDHTVKFWQIGTPSLDSVATDMTSTSPEPSPIASVSLSVRDGVVISSNYEGVVKTWDILNGFYKVSIQTPASHRTWSDIQLIESRLIVAWWDFEEIRIWDAERQEFLPGVDTHQHGVDGNGIRISQDGSKVFCLIYETIQAWAIQTGEPVGEVVLEDDPCLDPLSVGGSKIRVQFKDSPTQEWDFGISGISPVLLSDTSTNGSHLSLTGGTKWDTGPVMIKDMVTGQEVFQLVGRYAKPTCIDWDGQYLVAGYKSGEVLILDFNDAHTE